MAQQVINVGSSPNDGTGDIIRDAMIKVNSNFTELYNTAPILTKITIGNTSVNSVVNSTSISTANGVFTDRVKVGNTSLSATLNSIFYTATSNNSLYLNNVPANNYVNTSANFTITGVHTHTANIVIGTSAGLVANGSKGTVGQILYSNGTTDYWDSPPAQLNVASQYTWTNTQTFSNTITFSRNVVLKQITANNSVGTAGNVLVSGGSGNLYWTDTGLKLNNNTTDGNTFFIPFSNTSSGNWSNAVIATSKLYFIPSTGALSSTIFNSLSDRTQKEDIKIIEDAVDIIKSLNGVRFKWKENGTSSAGLIAQEVEEKMPELVFTDNVTGNKSLNYSGIIAVLVEAVKYLLEKEQNR